MATDDKKTSPAPKNGAVEKKAVAAKKDEGQPKDKTTPDAGRSKAEKLLLRIVCIRASSPHALATKVVAGCRTLFGWPNFSRFLPLRAHKRLSISLPHPTWLRRRDNTFTNLFRLSRHRRPKTTKPLHSSGSVARYWQAYRNCHK
jgi:hypothetical protein